MRTLFDYIPVFGAFSEVNPRQSYMVTSFPELQDKSDSSCLQNLRVHSPVKDAVIRYLERLPNFFAASKGSAIIAAGLMTEKIRFSGFLTCFRGFARLIRLTVEWHREHRHKTLSFVQIYL